MFTYYELSKLFALGVIFGYFLYRKMSRQTLNKPCTYTKGSLVYWRTFGEILLGVTVGLGAFSIIFQELRSMTSYQPVSLYRLLAEGIILSFFIFASAVMLFHISRIFNTTNKR